MQTRRLFIKTTATAGVGLFLSGRMIPKALAAVAGGTLDPGSIPKFVTRLLIPSTMPRTSRLGSGANPIDYYEIAMRQFTQYILPPRMRLSPSTVWGYGSINHPWTFRYPASSIEARVDRPARVKWINGLMGGNQRYQRHFLTVDQTLHWANPPGGQNGRDGRGSSQMPYTGPVPMVTHLHGAHTQDHSDGYAEAWFLPAAANIPAGYARTGTWYDYFKTKFQQQHGVTWSPGSATFQYGNDQRATALWFHDHSLGMTRTNIYAGPAGFYLLRGGPSDAVGGILPGRAQTGGDDDNGRDDDHNTDTPRRYEIPLVIQDRSFNRDGSLFYPGDRAFFEGLTPDQLQIAFIPDAACGGPSDVPPFWNAETFGNCMVVNGRTWPYLNVEKRRYRFRILNACNARFLILKMSNNMPIVQIGADGGFLPAPVSLSRLLVALAERADVIIDFTNIPVGTELLLQNIGPDEPFGGGEPGLDFTSADPQTTGQVMLFRVGPAKSVDTSTPAMNLVLPGRAPYGPPTGTRQVSLNELDSSTVRVITDSNGNVVQACSDPSAVPIAPTIGLLGVLNPDASGEPVMWEEAVTENPAVGTTEIWEIHNFTADAHPIHLHQTQFEVINREAGDGSQRGPEIWESGTKDVVIAYPGEITRVKTFWDIAGRYAWHCHILEHEDNEMMRPLHVGPLI